MPCDSAKVVENAAPADANGRRPHRRRRFVGLEDRTAAEGGADFLCAALTVVDEFLSWRWGPLTIAPFIGSFAGMLITRLPRGLPVVFARSRCDACGRRLSVLELLPIVAWLVARGRCRSCGGPISMLYPAVELAAIGLALWAVLVPPPGGTPWTSAVLAWTLLVLAVIDARDFLLPTALTVPLMWAGMLVAPWTTPTMLHDRVLGAALGWAAFTGVAAAYRQLRGREGLGGGDVWLLAAAGAWVSWTGLPTVIAGAGAIALAVVLARRVGGRPIDAAEPIPFGLYLCLAIWLVWLYGPIRADGSIAMAIG